MAEWIEKKLESYLYFNERGEHKDCLFLEMNDKKGVEYLDGSIVKIDSVGPLRKTGYGYIRYFGGRFEVVAPYRDQRFIFGLNPTYEIAGHMWPDPTLIEQQETRKYGE